MSSEKTDYDMETFSLCENSEETKGIIKMMRANNDRAIDNVLAKLIASCALCTGTLGVIAEDTEDEVLQRMAENTIVIITRETAEAVKEAIA